MDSEPGPKLGSITLEPVRNRKGEDESLFLDSNDSEDDWKDNKVEDDSHQVKERSSVCSQSPLLITHLFQNLSRYSVLFGGY